NAISRIAISPSDPNTIYVSTGFENSGGFVMVTHNDGATWQQFQVPGLIDWFGQMAVDPTNPQVAYLVRAAFTSGPGGHVFKTTNGGQTWTDISVNLPNIPTNAILIDPRTGTIYVGTDTGIYDTSDGGNTWSKFTDGLPNARVTDLVLNTTTNILAAATFRRGVGELRAPSTARWSGFKVMAPSSPVAGSPFTITVEALDQFHHLFTGYTGVVHFTSSDQRAGLPADAALTNGTGTFTVTLHAAG